VTYGSWQRALAGDASRTTGVSAVTPTTAAVVNADTTLLDMLPPWEWTK
jgi:hypothetical protein